MENQLDSVTEKPTCFLRLQGLACDWSKHNKHSRNIFSVHGFLRLSVSIDLHLGICICLSPDVGTTKPSSGQLFCSTWGSSALRKARSYRFID